MQKERHTGHVNYGSLLRLSVIIMFMIILVVGAKQSDATAVVGIRKATFSFCLWILFSLFFYNHSSIADVIVVGVILVWSGYESVVGLVQLINNTTYDYGGPTTFAGSFFNPGPFGGFLACALSVLIPTLLNPNTKNYSVVIQYKFFLLVVIVLSVLLLSFSNSRAAVLSLLCSTFFFAYETTRGRRFLNQMAIPICVIVLLMCTWGYLAKKRSADGRLFMGKICMHAMIENKLWGAGLGHFGEAYEKSQYDYFAKEISIKNGELSTGSSKKEDRQKACEPFWAFNMVFLVGIEMGFMSVAVFINVVILTLIILYQQCRLLFYGFMTITIFGLFSYSLSIWQFQLLFVIFISAASSLDCVDNHKIKKMLALASSLVVIPFLFCAGKSISVLHNYKEWQKDRALFNSSRFDLYVESCSEKARYLNHIDTFMMEYAYSLSKIGLIEKSDTVLLSCQSYHNNPGLLIMMGDNCVEKGDYITAEKNYIMAFIMLPDRIKPLYKLAQLYAISNNAVALHNILRSTKNYSFRIESGKTHEIRAELELLEKNYTKQLIYKVPVIDHKDESLSNDISTQ